MKKGLTLVLALLLCLAVVPVGVIGTAANSAAVYMIFANPGEDCTTQMNIGWHSDFDCTECYVEVTTADDKSFTKAVRYDGTYDDEAYKWFYDRLTTNTNTGNFFNKQFLDWGASLTGLIADTDYIYRIADGKGLYSATRKFKTAGADNFSIIWTSDPHVNSGYPGRITDYNNIIKFAEQQAAYDVAFQFSTGDNLACGDRYGDWLAVSEMKASKNYMFASTIGNHDVYDSAMLADPDYTNFWNSAEYFRIAMNNPQNAYTQSSQRLNGYYANPDVKHYVAGLEQYSDRSASELIEYQDAKGNTYLCTGANENLDGRAYWFNYNGILFIVFDYYAMMFDGDTENALNWASSVVEANAGKYEYIICSTHINMVNAKAGEFRVYGSTDYQHFQPFLDKYNVDVFITGDHHVYLRTGALLNGAETTQANLGTHIIQAPCISRSQTFDAGGASGLIKEMYSKNGATVGDLVIDVDEKGLTFKALVYDASISGTQYYVYDTYTVPKKAREVDNRVDFVVDGKTVATQYVKDGAAATAPVVDGYTVTAWDADFSAVTADMTVTATAFESTASFVYGDINADGNINAADASLVLQYDVKLTDFDETQLAAADVSGDKAVTAMDAALILQYNIKLITEFPAEK